MELAFNKNYDKIKFYGIRIFGAALPYFFYILHKKYQKSKKIKAFKILSGIISLSKLEAKARSEIIKEVSYVLYLSILKHKGKHNKDKVHGSIKISFDLYKTENVFIDYKGHVKSITVNGKECSVHHVNDRLYLDTNLSTHNTITINFISDYSEKELGLLTCTNLNFNDEFIFSNLGIFHGHTLYPCFDQPDIKAKFKTILSAPIDWECISNSNSINCYSNNEDIKKCLNEFKLKYEFPHIPCVNEIINSKQKLIEFEMSSKIPSYLFTLVAGLFELYKNEEINLNNINKDDIKINNSSNKSNKSNNKLNIYYRKGLKPNKKLINNLIVLFEETVNWLKTILNTNSTETKEDKETFDVFNQLNIVFVPNIKHCGIESSNCIIIDEHFITDYLDKVDNSYFYLLACHQLIFIWLQLCLTPIWWDQLCLLEGLALNLSTQCIKTLSPKLPEIFDKDCSIWLYLSQLKSQSIFADQFRYSHPVILDAKDTEMAEIMITDEIYINKCSSLLNYFCNIVDEKNFYKGLEVLIYKVQKGNIDYNDFFNIYEENFKNNSLIIQQNINPNINIINNINTLISNNISTNNTNTNNINNTNNSNIGNKIETLNISTNENKSFKTFFETSGVSKLDIDYYVRLNYIDEVKIFQKTCTFSNIIYTHKINILLVTGEKEKFYDGIIINSNRITEIKELNGVLPPDAIILNYDDTAYIRQIFDDLTTKWLTRNIYRLNSNNTKLVVLRDFSNMVKDGLLNAYIFIECVLNLLFHEKDLFIIVEALNLVMHIITNYAFFDNQPTPMKEIRRLLKDILIPKFADDIRDFLINHYIDAMDPSVTDQIRYLIHLLRNYKNEENPLSESFYTKDLKYSTKLKILIAFYESNISLNEKKLFESLLIKDDYEFENNCIYKCSCVAAMPNKEKKNLLWRSLVYNDCNLTIEESEAYMMGFMRKNQIVVRNIIKENFFDDFLYVKEFYSTEYALLFFKYLNPSVFLHDKTLKKLVELNEQVHIVDEDDYKIKKEIESTITNMTISIKAIKKNKSKS